MLTNVRIKLQLAGDPARLCTEVFEIIECPYNMDG